MHATAATSAPTSTALFGDIATEQVALDCGTLGTITATAILARSGNVLVELVDWPRRLTMAAALGAVRAAITDGRIKLADTIRSAIDRGADVI
jgi:hypothetical protein